MTSPETVSTAAPTDLAQLQTILLSSTGEGIDTAHVPDVRRIVGGTTFDQLVTLLASLEERVPPGIIANLYQYWIENNARSPHIFLAWFNLGATFSKIGSKENAATCFRNALAIKADFYLASINLGLMLENMGDTESALQVWEKSLQPDSIRIVLLNQRSRLLEQLKRLDEAERGLRSSLMLDPYQPDVIQHWTHIRQRMCLWPIMPADLSGLPPAELMKYCGPIGTMALTDDVAVQTSVNKHWISRKVPAAPRRLSPPEGYRHDKIRIGYMSSDFCNHAISFLIAELFEQHDRSAFEVFGYCFSPEDGSEVRARIVGAMDHYVSIKTLSDEQAAQRIRDDEIDILVDLNGLTAGARLPILRWKPAPVQATYLGYVGPVPLPELDYMFCDDVVVPPDIAPLYEPKPLSIAGNYQANDSKRKIGRPMTRAENNLPDGKFVFCCFSNHYKITEDMFTAWMTILKQTGDSVLWMASDTVWSTEAMRARAAASGVDPNRLLLAERVDPAMYMSRLRVADLFLDTFPYNAGTIASDAIRMQLPLVTLAGQSFASRMAARFLTALGATAGIANTLDDYAAIAIRLANDPASYAAYKAFYSESAWQETIGNVGLFTREYEATLHRVRLGGSA